MVTIDLYDPRPLESGGLVRPYELLKVGGSPLNWFEFSIAFYLNFGVSIWVGIRIFGAEITLFEDSYEATVEILPPLLIEPLEILPIGFLSPDGILSINPVSNANIKCIHLSGSLGEEKIECSIEENGKARCYQTFTGVASLLFENDDVSSTTYTFMCIESPISMDHAMDTTLDYSKCTADSILIGSNVTKVGSAELSFQQMTRGTIILPGNPKKQGLLTSVTDCKHPWEFLGHTNILIAGSRIQSGCTLHAQGEEFDAFIGIEFDEAVPSGGCTNGSSVDVDEDGDSFGLSIIPAGSSPIPVSLGRLFNVIEVRMSACNDTINIRNSPKVTGSIFIDGRGGDDTVTINNLSTIPKNIRLVGGNGFDSLLVRDDLSTLHNLDVTLNSFALRGIQPVDADQDLTYQGFERIDVYFSQGRNFINVTSTATDSQTHLFCGEAADIVTIEDTQGYLLVDGGDGDDIFNVWGLGAHTSAVIRGGDNNDWLHIDGVDGVGNKLNASSLSWSGGDDNDTATVVFAGTGDFNIDLLDDLHGINVLEIECTEVACDLLSRENFIAAIHDIKNSESSTAERVSFVRRRDKSKKRGWVETVVIDSISVELNGGNNSMFFDDTFGTMTVTGGSETDLFQIGQMFNGYRDFLVDDDPYVQHEMLLPMGWVRDLSLSYLNPVAFDLVSCCFHYLVPSVEVTNTTEGFLSNGNSWPLTISGRGGNDKFEVSLHQQGTQLVFWIYISSHLTCISSVFFRRKRFFAT